MDTLVTVHTVLPEIDMVIMHGPDAKPFWVSIAELVAHGLVPHAEARR